MLKGIDVSKWQGVMRWDVARSAGARFAFIRAGSISTEGYCYKDYQFDRNSLIAPEYMPVGYYWYLRPQFNPVEQANYFCNLVKEKPRQLPLVLDLENVGDPKMQPRSITTAASAFLRNVYNRLNEWCLVYTRGLWMNENTTNDVIWELVDCWLARYKTGLTSPWSDGSCKPNAWNDWKFWQYSAGGNGQGSKYGAQSKSIDLNYFNGDEVDFKEYLGVPTQDLIRINAPLAVSVRNGPEGAAIGATWRGAEWQVLEKFGDYYKVEGWLPADKVEPLNH